MFLFDKIVEFTVSLINKEPSPHLTIQIFQSMPKYQVKYLNLRGKGEPIRLLLNFVQEPFEDHRENYLEFAKYKDSK